MKLADADHVVNVDELLRASRENAPKDWGDAVLDMRLGKTLSGRGILHAQLGRRAQSISDLDRSVSILEHLVRLAADLDPPDHWSGQRSASLSSAQELLTRALELRASVLSDRVPRRPW